MTRCYVQEVVRKLSPGVVPDVDEDLDQYIVDQKNDCGVDFIYRTEGHVLIIQCKYHGPEKSEKEAEFSHFCEVLDRLFDKNVRKHENLEALVSEINWDTDTFDLRYISLGRVSDGIRRREDKGVVWDKFKDIDERCELRCIDEAGLNEEFREALSLEKGIVEEIEIPFSEASNGYWVEYVGEKRRAFVGAINGAQLANLCTRYRSRLFNLNIRNYVGNTSTNKGIIETAVNRADEFFFFNNGISAMATGIEANVKTGKIRCRQFSIVNGAQTAKSIAKAHRKNPEVVKSVDVLIRLSEIQLKDSDFIGLTTKYNNTQNAVRISDFRSNDKVQLSLSNHFGQLTRNGVKFNYKNKRSEREGNSIPIGMEDFIKTIFSFRFGPADAFGGNSHLFDTSPTGGYFKIFGDGTQPLSNHQFNELAGVWLICEKAGEYLKQLKVAYAEGPDALSAKGALERRWLYFFAFGELLRNTYSKDGDGLGAQIVKLADPRKILEQKAFEVIKEYADNAAALLVLQYGQESAKEEFAHRNWFRDSQTIEKIKSQIRLSPLYKKLPKLIA